MENIISKEQLNTARGDARLFSALLNESRVALERRAYSYEVTVFLSHYHGEGVVLENVISTAMRIKEKIRSSKKFILLATEAAIASKWCNWELGFGDACRFPTDIAIMPIKESRNQMFSGSEYLQIYPIITNEYQYSIGNYYVEFRGNKITLAEWLKK